LGSCLASNPLLEQTHLEIGCHIEQIDDRALVGSTQWFFASGHGDTLFTCQVSLSALTARITPVRIVLQRVSSALVRVEGSVVGSIGNGLCLLVGVSSGDGYHDVDVAVDKIVGLRVFNDDEGKMNLSLVDIDGQILVVSQFTLAGDVKRGRRPSFTDAARPEDARPLIDRMIHSFRERDIVTAHGVFGATMDVELTNDGPVTLVLDVEDGVAG
jgi:D-aminoacyl-tRNA deacylase